MKQDVDYDLVFSKIYKDSYEALHALNMLLLAWNQGGKHQRFGQFLESEYGTLCLPLYYYESNDSYEVFSYICDLIEREFNS